LTNNKTAKEQQQLWNNFCIFIMIIKCISTPITHTYKTYAYIYIHTKMKKKNKNQVVLVCISRF